MWLGKEKAYKPGPHSKKYVFSALILPTYTSDHICIRLDNPGFNVGYAVGGASGPAYQDQITIGGATVKSQFLGAANSTWGLTLVSPIDGVSAQPFFLTPISAFIDGLFQSVGFGPPNSNANQFLGYNSTPTFYESLYAQGSIDQPIFGIHINGLDPLFGSQVGRGEITFGGIDPLRAVGECIIYEFRDVPLN